MEQKREIWLDVARAFACACVIMVHSPAKYDGLIPGQYVLAPLNYILMAWGVGLFFALSGALLVGLFSYVIVRMLSKLPYSKYLLG